MAEPLDSMRAQLAEHGYEVEVAEARGGPPSIVVHLGDDERKRHRGLAITPTPPMDESGALGFVQFFAELPFSPPKDLAPLYRALAVVNNRVGLGSFGIDAQQRLYYRYTVAAGADGLPGPVLVDLVGLTAHIQEFYGDYVEGVCTGDISSYVLDEVIARSSG